MLGVYEDQTGFLTIRAANDLDINSSLSDGFSDISPDAALLFGESWSYQLIAGADNFLGNFSANINSKNADYIGNLNINSGNLVRTGTGNITAVAAGDINLQNQLSVLYSAGRRNGHELDIEKETLDLGVLTGFFELGANSPIRQEDILAQKYIPVDSGDVTLIAGRNIDGDTEKSSTAQLFNDWYITQNSQVRDPRQQGQAIIVLRTRKMPELGLISQTFFRV